MLSFHLLVHFVFFFLHYFCYLLHDYIAFFLQLLPILLYANDACSLSSDSSIASLLCVVLFLLLVKFLFLGPFYDLDPLLFSQYFPGFALILSLAVVDEVTFCLSKWAMHYSFLDYVSAFPFSVPWPSLGTRHIVLTTLL